MLAAHVAQVRLGAARLARVALGVRAPARAARRGGAAAQHAHRAAQALDAPRPRGRRRARLAGARAGEAARAQPGAARRLRHRERAPRGPHARRRAPARRTARGSRAARAESCPLAASSAHAIARSRPGPALRHVARREVRRDPPRRELEAGVEDRGVHALARLAHRRVGEADDRERGQPARTSTSTVTWRVCRPSIVNVCARASIAAPPLAALRNDARQARRRLGWDARSRPPGLSGGRRRPDGSAARCPRRLQPGGVALDEAAAVVARESDQREPSSASATVSKRLPSITMYACSALA